MQNLLYQMKKGELSLMECQIYLVMEMGVEVLVEMMDLVLMDLVESM